MILYHFTDIDSLSLIMKYGLSLGNTNTHNDSVAVHGVVWLTTSSSPRGHGLTFGESVTEYERHCHRTRYGREMPDGFNNWPDKSRVRIKLIIPSNDKNLVHWVRWHGKRTEARSLDLAKCGDATRLSSRSWHLYFGIITPDRFVSVEVDGAPYTGLKEAA